MAEYTPLFVSTKPVTYKASATVTGGQVLVASGAGTVAPSTGASTKVLGVASKDAAVNDILAVWHGDVHELTAAGAITAGDKVESAAAGAVATSTTAANFIGTATTSALDGAKVVVKFDLA